MSDFAAELLVACEKVSLDDGGRPVLERAFTYLELDTFPAALAFMLYTEIWGPPFATVRAHAQIDGPGGETVERRDAEGVALDDEGFAMFAVPFKDLPLRGPGVYTASLVADGVLLGSRRFRVALPWSRTTETGTL